ncbi:fatty acid cis/trans isomerase [Hoeflea poritis]|uniref:Fatty acid cis/trans isomerase n=1 Tax=Hoeflea poritis TaxID=2993659 RepID=A0ABT4VT94_9HYPH|nr:fatty acid cis/trans isomerase [Hoeflea poritis]MDA4847933.1 fatty acid cis/trans isomerase [Hoeflea poritis]
MVRRYTENAFHIRPLRYLLCIAALFLLSACGDDRPATEADGYPPMPVLDAAERAASDQRWSGVQDVVEKRCVVCHGCYDAPCQLKLSSPDGLLRGASKERVYDPSRLKDAPLTRLGIDATTEAGWRKLGFYPVVKNPDTPDAYPSIVSGLLTLGRANPPPADKPLPDEIDLDIHRKLSCPAPDELENYMADHPHGGMPYGTAPLSDAEFSLLSEWAASGAPLPMRHNALPEQVSRNIAAVEAFLNGDDMRQRLAARYIFEHLFLAHLHIESDTPDRFFRVIRSRTPPGEAADEIATRRPFDDPGEAPFYYRIVPIDGTILHKEHMVYEIGPERIARYRALFLSGDKDVETLPPYSAAAGGNPFSTFAALPADGRYRFLLDDALFFVRSFIRGPVCYGQVAVDVIEDRFWVSFLDPASDLSVTDPSYLREAAPLLELPVANTGGDLKSRLSGFLSRGPVKYLQFRDLRYRSAPSYADGPAYTDIWDGGGGNLDARLTVYRNFDNASVVTGFVGAVPETAWVIDYPLFERIYYDLVAGFDVFGNIEHQLTTRLYMDNLRREGETIFLSFLPPDVREPLHERWYRGPLAELVDRWKEQPVDTSAPTAIEFATDDPKAEFLETLLTIGPRLWPVFDPINRCSGADCAKPDTPQGRLRAIASRKGPWVKYMPDIALLLVETPASPLVFTLAHDKAHSNVAFLFREENRREPENDRLTIVPGQFASYPNFHFRVGEDTLPAFVAELQTVTSQAGYMRLVEKYGVRRSSPGFWTSVDRVQAAMNAQNALQAGLLDLNRYKDPRSGDPVR